MLEEALPIAAGVAIALLPAMAFGGISAARNFMILAAEDSGFFKALEEGKSEEEALKIAMGEAPASPVIHTPMEPYRNSIAAAQQRAQAPMIHTPLERSAPSFGFAARFLQ